MNVTWMYQKKPTGKPLTPAQTALLGAIKAAGTRTFDASTWNVRTVWGLFHAGLIYVNCDGNLKTVALIVHESPVSADETPAAPAADSAETVTPIGALLSDKQLLNGRVQYQAFAQYQVPTVPEHKDLLHTGIISAVHNHPLHGLMVRIVPDANTLDLVAGWYVLNRHVTGWAVVEGTEAPASAAVAVIDQPTVETVAAAEPVAAQPAHMTDAGRYVGAVGPVYTGYAYINEDGGGDIRTLSRNVLGGVTLVKGMRVTYRVIDDLAVTVVVVGHAASEASYTRLMSRTTATPAPRPRRTRDINAHVAAKSARDKIAMRAAMDAVLSQK